jgi:hypothetical protein
MKNAFVAGLLAIAGVNGARSSFVMPEDGGETVEHLRRVPEGWNDIGAPSANHNMHFRVAVRSVSLNHLVFLRRVYIFQRVALELCSSPVSQ